MYQFLSRGYMFYLTFKCILTICNNPHWFHNLCSNVVEKKIYSHCCYVIPYKYQYEVEANRSTIIRYSRLCPFYTETKSHQRVYI